MIFALIEILRGYLMIAPFHLRNLGAKGEYFARRYFHRRGYHLVAKNWRHGHGEIDIIMANWREVLFIEVKTRSSEASTANLISFEQENRLRNLSETYLQEYGDLSHRLLLVHVLVSNGQPRITVMPFPKETR
jgi:putative endonuclease